MIKLKSKLILFFFIILLSHKIYSQTVFNRIIEDTAAHITNSVIALDTGYVFLSGTRNTHNIRSFSLTYINEEGEKQWKKIYGDSQNQHWEGWFGNLRQNVNVFYLGGSYRDIINGTRGVHITVFDSLFNLKRQNILFNDTIDKRAYQTIKGSGSNYYIAGQTYDYPTERYRLFMLKADSLGNYLWHKQFGTNVNEYGSYIIETLDGNILTGGTTSVTNVNNTRWYLLKTDTSGNIIWENYYGRNGYDNGYIRKLLETQDSGYLACGFYPIAKPYAGDSQIAGCLRKIDKNGELLWERIYKNFSKITNPSIFYMETNLSSIMLQDNYIYVLGNNRDHRGASRGYLQRLNKDGNICWHRDYYAIDTNSTYQWLVDFKSTNDGGFILAGYGNAYDRFGYFPPQQAWLVKTDSLGMDGLSNIEPDALNVDIDLPGSMICGDTLTVNIYISGKSAPYTLEFSTGQVIGDIFYPPTFVPVEVGLDTVEFIYAGNVYHTEIITEATISNHEWGQCIVKPIEFFTPDTLGIQDLVITVRDAYGESKTIVKEIVTSGNNCIDPPEEEPEDEITEISLFPNPVSESLNIEIPAESSFTVLEIYNLIGELVHKTNLSNGSNSISTANLSSGIYIAKIICKNTNKSINKKFEKI